MKEKGLLLVISGPSGVGKGTVIRELLTRGEHLCGKKLFLSISATTRSPRPGEQEGEHYYFISREKFEAMIGQNAFLEHATYAGNLYGTPKGPVTERLAQGEVVVFDIDVQGAYQIQASMPEDTKLVFLAPPSMEELEQRLRGRQTETDEVICRRIAIAQSECAQISKFDHCVYNITVSHAVEEICELIRRTFAS